MKHLQLLPFIIACIVTATMPSQAFSSTQITIAQAGYFPFTTNAAYSYRFTFALDSPPNGVNRVFCAFAGKHINSNVSLDFYTNLIFTNSANVMLEFNSFGDMKVYSMIFCIIATTPAAYPYLDVEDYLIPTQNLSDPTLTINATNTVLYPTLASNLFFKNGNFLIIPYFSFYKCQSLTTAIPGVAILTNNININSSNYVLRILISAGATLTLIKATVIIVDLNIINSLNKIYYVSPVITVIHDYTSYTDRYLSSQVSPIPFPSLYGPKFSRNCTFGMYISFAVNNGLNKKILFDYSTSLGFTNIQQGGHGLGAYYYAFCTADCSLDGYYNTTTANCQNCATYMANCMSCTNSTYCTSCGLNAYYDPLWKQCHCNGFWVTGGCTGISYCEQVEPSTGRCLRCGQNFTLSLAGNSCDCLTGNLGMSGICISISGCLTAAKVHGNVQCVACNTTADFRITLNSTCTCIDGLTLSNDTCKPICGDGLVYSNEVCDDGNTINGDGCSSICTVQKFYKCTNGSTTHKSDCYYANRNIKLSLTRIYKDTKDNIGFFVFTFIPAPSILNKINFTSSTAFTIAPRHQIQSISFAGSQLTIQTAYQQDLEGQFASLSLNLDRNIILQNQLSLNFSIKSSNFPLLIFKYYDQLKNLQLIILILVGITLFLFILGSWSHEMIGIQTITIFLMIYFTLSIQEVGTLEIFSPLSQLKYLTNYDGIFKQQTVNPNNIVEWLDIRQKFIENNFIIQFVLLLGQLILVGILLNHQIKKRSKNKLMSKINTCFSSYPFQLLFYILMLPIALSYFIQTFITAILSIMTVQTRSFPFQTIFLLAGIGSNAFIISLECSNIIYNQASRKNGIYFFVYIANTITFVILLILAWLNPFFVYLLAAQSGLYIIFLIIYRPYSQKMHLFGVIFNQLTIISWLAIIIVIKGSSVNQDAKYLFISVIVILLICVDIIAGIRIIYQLYNYGPQKKTIIQSLSMSLTNLRRQEIQLNQNPRLSSKFNVNFTRQPFQPRQDNENIFKMNSKAKTSPYAGSMFFNQQEISANRRRKNSDILVQMRGILKQALLKQHELHSQPR